MTPVEPVGRFAKDAGVEDFLERMNRSLVDAHDAELVDLEAAPPALHVIGAPRTGTTLLTQLVAAHLEVGYVNQLTAAFWQAPLYGLRLSHHLLGEERSTNFVSRFGRTDAIHEPHEFGYFWRRLLGYSTMTEGEVSDTNIDWAYVSKVLRNMTSEVGAPMVFKSFLLGWHLRAALAAMPETCFAWVRRDTVATAMSILRFREEFAGDRDRWVSLRPRSFDQLVLLPRAEQVVGQVRAVERSIEHQIEAVSSSNVAIIDYEDLCDDPPAVLETIKALLAANGADVQAVGRPPQRFVNSDIGDPDDPDLTAVRAACEASARSDDTS